ncbi:hypothetical protein HHK36_017756 [Tetracentron sinense]|uniref:Uncharacterized protein n=1 Tax=Tetracentron sinense TaxID=13715 RepID=A0A834Z117_TETSI|nr:hypothetical protein HHK36_017756 [Tetracentron sinense]
MIIFSSKAYNLFPLVPFAKAALTDRTVDPFLHLVEDCKLQAVNTGSDHPKKLYGSDEDNNAALKSLSALEITENQTKESFASLIVKSLGKLSDPESSTIREQLLNEFFPDDVCPLGAQMFMEMPQVHQLGSRGNKSLEEVAPPIFTIDDDVFPDAFENQTNPNSQLAVGTPNLLSVNQLLESVWNCVMILKVLETACQVGRFSVSTTSDMPYKEMASHCEALLMGKQQKMSTFMSALQKQENLISFSSQDHKDEVKNMSSYSHFEVGFPVISNPFLDQNVTAYLHKQSISTGPMLCANEYQHHPQFFRLPASTPYYNFLKAAGC